MKPLPHGGQLEYQLPTGHTITLVHRPDQGDYRVTVIKMGELFEARNIRDEHHARAHARHLVHAYRTTTGIPCAA